MMKLMVTRLTKKKPHSMTNCFKFFSPGENKNFENMAVATNPNHTQTAVLTAINRVNDPGAAYQII